MFHFHTLRGLRNLGDVFLVSSSEVNGDDIFNLKRKWVFCRSSLVEWRTAFTHSHGFGELLPRPSCPPHGSALTSFSVVYELSALRELLIAHVPEHVLLALCSVVQSLASGKT